MKITVNGIENEFEETATLSEVVASLGVNRDSSGVAAAVNGQVVPRREWPDAHLSPGDRVEVLRAVAGG